MLVCGLALWRGRDDERLAAAAYLANWAITLVVFKSRSFDTQWYVMALDVALLALYVWLAMRSGRFWPLFAAAFILLIVVTHLAHAVDGTVSGWAYITATLIWSYLALIAIGYGAWTAPYYDTETPDPAEAPGATLR